MKKHFKIKVFGKVQGVWYRGSTQRKARELGVNGFVQNEKDGSVYMEAEGDEEVLKKLVEWCNDGPELAVVERVEVTEGDVEGFSSFDILR